MRAHCNRGGAIRQQYQSSSRQRLEEWYRPLRTGRRARGALRGTVVRTSSMATCDNAAAHRRRSQRGGTHGLLDQSSCRYCLQSSAPQMRATIHVPSLSHPYPIPIPSLSHPYPIPIRTRASRRAPALPKHKAPPVDADTIVRRVTSSLHDAPLGSITHTHAHARATARAQPPPSLSRDGWVVLPVCYTYSCC